MIEDINTNNIDEALPLIRQYQEFYKIQNIDDNKNKLFFSQFGINTEKGCLFAFRKDNKIVAFATVYFTYASSIISKVAIMNDLYTIENYRGKGIATRLIKHCEMYAKSKNASRLQWVTSKDNTTAQAVYLSLGAKQSSWEFFTYST